jgi:3'(2'), 5'-bisphosphate nucleotidase
MERITPELARQIQQIVRECGLQAEQMAAAPFEIVEKGPEDYVTSIDAILDRQLAAAFSHLFPADGVITEEDRRSRQQFYDGYSRLWCIDPLDGTEDFIWGKRNYAVMVGLLENYQPTAGWIYAPTQDRMYFGGLEWGVFESVGDRPPEAVSIIQPAPPSANFCPIVIGHRDQTRYGAAIAQQIPGVQFYSIGSFGLKVMEVVCGRAGLYLYFNGRVKLWDTTGPLALAKAAGLTCCSLKGEPIRFSPDAINPETLAHTQSILVGWPDYIEQLRPKLEVAASLQN